MSDRIVVLGAGGQLGRRLVRAFERTSAAEVVGLDRRALDVTERVAVHGAVDALRPRWIVNAAAMTAVDACEREVERAVRLNALAVRWLVEAAERAGARVCQVSTDYVFDGTATRPYTEADQPNPMSVYGLTKLQGERELRPGIDSCVRTSWLMSADDRCMLGTIDRLRRGPGPLRFVEDQVGSPSFADDVALGIVELVRREVTGVIHVTNDGQASWYDVAREALRAFGDDPHRVEPIATTQLAGSFVAPRPAFSVLAGVVRAAVGLEPLRPWQEALGAAVSERARG